MNKTAVPKLTLKFLVLPQTWVRDRKEREKDKRKERKKKWKEERRKEIKIILISRRNISKS